MIGYIFILTILISLIIVSKENHDDIVSVLVDEIQQETNITCLCTENEQCDSNTRTCRLKHSDHACYESWSKELGDNTIEVTAGCIYNEFLFTKIICNGNHTNRYIICCSDKDYCNDRDAYSIEIRKQLLLLNKPDRFLFKLILLIICSVMLLFLLFILFILFRIKRRDNRKKSSNPNKPNESNKYQCLFKNLFPRSKSPIPDVKTDEISTSSSGCGRLSEKNRLIKLRPRKFTEQITLEDRIGIGAYGCVYRGRWDGDVIAVKIFLSSEEPSWDREVEIYKTPGLNHDNILRYIAADNTDISHRIELWLATEYHENGSVYDYLMNHTITIPILNRMIFSIVSGLWTLHKSIDATDGKVALAHRDLKTKNILVKRDLSCCIADLGLAVKEVRQKQNDQQEHIVIDIKPNHRVGTIRYMAPEILDKTLNYHKFESYKAADMYALGLIFWEILRRCQTTPKNNDADVYELPYQNVLPHNPSFEHMHEVVCVQKIRPSPSPRWKTNPILDYIFDLCQELWAENPACRPSSCHIKKQFQKRFESIDNDLSGINIESRNEGPQTV